MVQPLSRCFFLTNIPHLWICKTIKHINIDSCRQPYSRPAKRFAWRAIGSSGDEVCQDANWFECRREKNRGEARWWDEGIRVCAQETSCVLIICFSCLKRRHTRKLRSAWWWWWWWGGTRALRLFMKCVGWMEEALLNRRQLSAVNHNAGMSLRSEAEVAQNYHTYFDAFIV